MTTKPFWNQIAKRLPNSTQYMMKQIFNKAGAGVLTAVIATAMAGFGGPTGANAQTATSTRERPNPFCSTVLPRLTTKMQERFTEQVKRLNERQGNRTNK